MKTITILFIFLAAGCGGGNADYTGEPYTEPAMVEMSEEASMDVPSKSSYNGNDQATEIEKKVIKTGGLSYRVEEIKKEYARIKSLLAKYDAYINSENENKGYDRINYSISAKVPPEHFDALVAGLSEGKKLDSKWVNMNDVTERYYDLQSRITNKKKLEERYQQILKKAVSIKDILEIERNLNQVRSEIESLQGQFKLLSHQVNFSTIDISFYELIPYEVEQEQRPGFGARILNAISAGWQGFLTFLVYILALWPFGLVALGVVWVVRKIRSRKKKADL